MDKRIIVSDIQGTHKYSVMYDGLRVWFTSAEVDEYGDLWLRFEDKRRRLISGFGVSKLINQIKRHDIPLKIDVPVTYGQ